MEISLREPFDFSLTLGFLRAFSPMAGEQRVSGDALTKSWMVGETAVAVTMKQRGARLSCALDKRLDAKTEAALADRVASFVSADEDLTELYALASRDEQFAPVAKKLRGFHHPKFGTPFEAAIWSVLNQRVGIAQARKMKAALVRGPRRVPRGPHARAAERARARAHARQRTKGEGGLRRLAGLRQGRREMVADCTDARGRRLAEANLGRRRVRERVHPLSRPRARPLAPLVGGVRPSRAKDLSRGGSASARAKRGRLRLLERPLGALPVGSHVAAFDVTAPRLL